MNKSLLLLAGFIFIHLLLLVNSQFTIWPEMILYPYLQLNNFRLYSEIVNPYFPLLTLTLSSFFQILGVSILNLKIFTWIIILVLDILVFYSSYLIHKDFKKSFLSLGTFIILNLSLGGNGLWFELALAPFILFAAIRLVTSKLNNKLVLMCGVLLSICILVKQNAALFCVPLILYLMQRKQFRLVPIFFLPIILALASLSLFLFNQGIWQDFINWSILLPLSYTSQPGFILLPTKRQFLMILVLNIPLLMYLLKSSVKDNEKLFWGLIFIISTIFTFPRYENFHLQVLICFTALFLPFANRLTTIILLSLFLATFIRSYQLLWMKPDRFLDSETIVLSEKIKLYPSVYLLNSPDLAYFLAKKLPPKPWGTNFPWYFENFDFEAKFISGLKNERTDYVVIGDRVGGGKYDLGNYLPVYLMNFIKDNYFLEEKFERYQIWKRKN